MNDQKSVIVMGGSSGIGKATAVRFAEEGWRVAIGAPDADQVTRVCSQLDGVGHVAVELDVTNDESVTEAVSTVKSTFGEINAIVNSVGVSEPNHVIDSDFHAWNRQLDLMLYGCFRVMRGFVPIIKSGGRIINITSIHHERVCRGYSSYAIAKAAITQYTRTLALELADRGILANSIAPGFVSTQMSYKNGRNELESQWFQDNYVKYDHLPLRRAAQPEEIAGVALFLAGPDATYITGSVITVDGGLTITF